jgi:hypothetical protein
VPVKGEPDERHWTSGPSTDVSGLEAARFRADNPTHGVTMGARDPSGKRIPTERWVPNRDDDVEEDFNEEVDPPMPPLGKVATGACVGEIGDCPERATQRAAHRSAAARAKGEEPAYPTGPAPRVFSDTGEEATPETRARRAAAGTYNEEVDPNRDDDVEESLEDWHNNRLFEALKKRWTK